MNKRPLLRFGKSSALALGLLISLLLISPAAQAAGTVAVSVTAPSQPVAPGSQFSVTVTIQPNNAIAGAQFDLSFNPAVARVTSVSEGTLFRQNGAATYFSPGTINNSTGLLSGVSGVIITPGQTVSASGVLANIVFTATSTRGTSALNLSNVVVGDASALSLPTSLTNASVTTDRSPVLNSIGAKAVAWNSNLSFSLSGSDADGDSLTYSASNLPSGATFSASSRTFAWTPTSSQIGSYPNVHFQVSDGTLSAAEDITITVNKITPAFSNLSAPSISYATPSTTLAGTLKSGSLVPSGSVSVTLNGVTQNASIQSNGSFSASFNTASLAVGGSPYAINYSYPGDPSFNSLSDSSKSLTVAAVSASVTLSNLNRTYDGTAKSASVSTNPSGLNVSITYNGSSNAPTGAGSYAVVASVSSPNYSGSANGTLVIAKAAPTFSGLSSLSINSGTPSTSVGGSIKSGSLVPGGNVSITINGVTQTAAIQANGNFSASFNTGSLLAGGSPYTITFSYPGDSNFSSQSDSSTALTVVQAYAAWDVNQDGMVNVLDMSIAGQHWAETGTPGWIAADVNRDGIINTLDLILIGQHWTG
jgi:hypothetical protein